MLDREEEGTVYADFQRALREGCESAKPHDDRSGGRSFGAVFIQSEKGFMENVRDEERLTRREGGDAIEVGAARGEIKSMSQAQFLQAVGEREKRRREGELRQIKSQGLGGQRPALGQESGSERFLQFCQVFSSIGEDDEELEVVVCIGQSEKRISGASGISERCGHGHGRHVRRLTFGELKRLRRGGGRGKGFCPGGLEINGIDEDEASGGSERVGNEVADAIAGLGFDPSVDGPGGVVGMFNEIELFQWSVERGFQKREVGRAKGGAHLPKEAVGGQEQDRWRHGVFGRGLGGGFPSRQLFFEGRKGLDGIFGREVEDSVHLLQRGAAGTGLGHDEGGLNGIGREDSVAGRSGEKVDPESIDGDGRLMGGGFGFQPRCEREEGDQCGCDVLIHAEEITSE